MEKTFVNALIVGRFQVAGPHLGHQSLIDMAASLAENVVIMISSSQEYGTERNPFCYETRANMFRETYGKTYKSSKIILRDLPDLTNENDITTEWGKHILTKQKIVTKRNPDIMIFGDDDSNEGWFAKEDSFETSMLKIPRARIDISATQLRQWMAQDDRESWMEFTHPRMHSFYDEIRGELMQIDFYKQLSQPQKVVPQAVAPKGY